MGEPAHKAAVLTMRQVLLHSLVIAMTKEVFFIHSNSPVATRRKDQIQ